MRSAMLAAGLVWAIPLAAAPVPSTKPADDPVSPSAARLLQFRKIQKELKLTPAQRIALVDGVEDISEAIERKREKLLRDPNPTPDIFEKLEAEQKKSVQKFLASATTNILTPESRARLRQINAQVRGIEVLGDPAVQKLLSLTEKQKDAVSKAVKEQEEKIESYLNLMGNDSADNLKEELLKFRSEQTKAISGQFTPDQKVLWTSFLGEPVKGFDLVEMWITLIETEDEPAMP
ncbi:MAG: hypothetical protein U0791_16100 [Gemmataceae bacterium]